MNIIRYWHGRLLRRAQLLLGSGRPEESRFVRPLQMSKLKRQYNVNTFTMQGGNPNDPSVLRLLQDELKPDFAINIYCKKLFRKPLLDSMHATINYHNGKLPKYRGLRASNWSIYQDESASGYTFHYMDDGFDTGNILLEGEVSIEAHDTAAELELRKSTTACSDISLVLEKLKMSDFGQSQDRIGCEHTREAVRLVTKIDEPYSLSTAEIQKRLRACRIS